MDTVPFKPLSENGESVNLSPGAGGDTGEGGKSKKRLSVERIYQKKTQLEHILLRPDSYIGSTEPLTAAMWVFDSEEERMVQRDVTYTPGLFKIFDEILVNAADHKQVDGKMSMLKIEIDAVANRISIWNNGKGIPVVEHQKEKVCVPTLIFGHLLTSSNYDDSMKKVTGGRNGYGAKLCNIFSTKFTVETQCAQYKKSFKQVWANNMTKAGEAKIKSSDAKSDSDFTCVTFEPDLAKFKMTSLDKDTVDLFTKRAYDVAASTKGIKVYLNKKRLPVKDFQEYVQLYIKGQTDEDGEPPKVIYEQAGPRWEVACTVSTDKGFQQVSFVNSIATTKGGRHVEHVTEQLTTKLMEIVKKKAAKGVTIKPVQIRNNMWVFVNALIENPTFDSQTKETMTLQVKQFGSKCVLTDKFLNQVNKCGIVQHVLNWVKFKAQTQLDKKCSASKHSKLKGIPKLDDANFAGTKNSDKCTLILTEGDSAKTLAIAGLSVIGRDYYGVFPLKGKVLNVREANHKQIMENAEVNHMIKIVGLQYKKKYTDPEELKTLRYRRIMIMTDQDQDGSHIKGLLINFIHFNWPNLLRHNILIEFITPIVKVTKGKDTVKSFYSLPEFEEWKNETADWNKWRVKYYKGLGTSTSKEAKEYFSDLARHKIPFRYLGPEDDACIEMAFSKKRADDRKVWLSNWMEERKERLSVGLSEQYLYRKDTRSVTYSEFVNKELVLFSNMDNERSIPSLVDGLKPGQRKVLFTCLKRNLTREIKVAQLAGSVSELSAYHHGEMSLTGTIVNLAQDFVGSNNVNLLLPIGQFGTRLQGGKDQASPRYIFTALSPLTRSIFQPDDDAILQYQFEEGQVIEPMWYCPIIPMVLVNGADGIGTGWSTKIPNYNVRQIISNLRRLIKGEDVEPMLPFYRHFTGLTETLEDQRYVTYGEVSVIGDDTVEITELPVRTWTQTYKENVLEVMQTGSGKVKQVVQDIQEYHTDVTVKFKVKLMDRSILAQAEETGLHKFFKLQSTISVTAMYLFNAVGVMTKYDSPEEILSEFYTVRLDMYNKRREYMIGMLSAEALKLANQARFILEKVDGKVVIENRSMKQLIELLQSRKYDSDPVKAWKSTLKSAAREDEQGQKKVGSDDDEDEGPAPGADFDYLVDMKLRSLTNERKKKLLEERDRKNKELDILKKKTPKDLWVEDLDKLSENMDKQDVKESKEREAVIKKGLKDALGKKSARAPKVEYARSPHGVRVAPRLDVNLIKKVPGTKRVLKKDVVASQEVIDLDPLPLSERLGKAGVKKLGPKITTPKLIKSRAKPKGSPSNGKMRQTKLTDKGVTKKKKSNPWSDSEDSDGGNSDAMSGISIDGDSDVAPRERAPRRQAAGKAKLKFDSTSEEDEQGDDDMKDWDASGTGHSSTVGQSSKGASPMDSGSDFAISDDGDGSDYAPSSPKKKASPKKPALAKPAPKNKIMEDDDDIVDLSDSGSDAAPSPIKKSPAKPKAAPVKPKAAPLKRTLGKSAPSELKDSPLLTAFAKAKPATKAAAPEKRVFEISDDDDMGGSDSDCPPPAKKKPAPRKPAAAKKPAAKKPAAAAKKPAPAKKAAPAKKTTSKTAIFDSDSDADGSDFGSKPAPKKGKKKSAIDSDSDDDVYSIGGDDNFSQESAREPTRALPGRAKKPVTYAFDSDGDSDF